MFDIGFLELVIIATVALLVIGPERLPGAVRTGAMYLRRIKRGFNDIRREVEQELHNDEVMQELKKTRQQVSDQADQWRDEMSRAEEQLSRDLQQQDATAADTEANPVSDSNYDSDNSPRTPRE